MQQSWRPWTRGWWVYLGLIAASSAMVFFGLRLYRAIEEDLSTAAIAGRASISILAASTLSQDFRRLIDVGRALATRVRFGELIAAGRWQDAAQIMATVPTDFTAVEQILITDAQGNLRAAIPSRDMTMGISFAKRDWYHGVVASAKPFLSGVQLDDGDIAHGDFFVAVPVLNAKGELLGILAMRVATHRFLSLFAQLHLEPSASIQVIDHQGLRAYDSASTTTSALDDMSANPIVRRVLNGEAGVVIDDSDGPDSAHTNDVSVSTFAPTLFGWGVIAKWPRATVFSVRDKELQRVAVASALIAAMTIVAVALMIQLMVERKQTETERRANAELESRVRERTAQLENMNRELESFSYSISHDLRAPLRAIDGFAHLLVAEKEPLLDSEAKRYVDNVHRNVAHMARLIDELLELSRVGRVALNYQFIDMNSLVSEVLFALRANDCRARIVEGKLPPIHGDVAMIRQIWVNLIDNAVKYSSHASEPQVSISGDIGGSETIYCVADNGVGFDMRHYEQLFQPFSRLHSPGEFAGTGVGLAIVKRAVERHDGRVWGESVSGEGTKMYFALPRRSQGIAA